MKNFIEATSGILVLLVVLGAVGVVSSLPVIA
jgi:hypothetical protein